MPVFYITLGLIFPLTNQAHEDPRGDVHPVVQVENGNFAVYFRNKSTGDDPDHRRFRTLYSPKGKLLAPRHAVEEWPERRRSIHRRSTRVGEEVIQVERGIQPAYLVSREGNRQRHRLPWPDHSHIAVVHDVHADHKTITLAVTDVEYGHDLSLILFHFDRYQFDPPKTVSLGHPATIYSFPVASNIVHAKGRYWIAWMRREPGEHEAKETVLSSWVPGETEATHLVMDTPSDWNSSLSLAASGDTLCLAYHCFFPEEWRSRIITVFHRMDAME